MIAAITLIAEQHLVLVGDASAFGAVLAFAALPVVVLDTHRHTRRHFDAAGMS